MAYSDNTTQATAITTGQIDWAADYIPNAQSTYLNRSPDNHYWVPEAGSDGLVGALVGVDVTVTLDVGFEEVGFEVVVADEELDGGLADPVVVGAVVVVTGDVVVVVVVVVGVVVVVEVSDVRYEVVVVVVVRDDEDSVVVDVAAASAGAFTASVAGAGTWVGGVGVVVGTSPWAFGSTETPAA